MLSKHVTIFEGCDGSGKSTAAAAYAKATNARLVHLGPFPRVGSGLGRMYAEAMMPAVLGLQDVVLDRSWLSEPIYGAVFREGEDRIGNGSQRMLERLALRCGAVVVWCDPGLAQVKVTYEARHTSEVLNGKRVDFGNLARVHSLYEEASTDLPEVYYNYMLDQQPSTMHWLINQVTARRNPCHPVGLLSAGNWDAKTVIVGQEFAYHKNQDPLYQWPFASFSQDGCSQWLAQQLDIVERSEADLLWVNADQMLTGIHLVGRKIISLGEEAGLKIDAQGKALKIEDNTFIKVPHPQFWKRFHAGKTYPLLRHL